MSAARFSESVHTLTILSAASQASQASDPDSTAASRQEFDVNTISRAGLWNTASRLKHLDNLDEFARTLLNSEAENK